MHVITPSLGVELCILVSVVREYYIYFNAIARSNWRLPPSGAPWKRTAPVLIQCSTAK